MTETKITVGGQVFDRFHVKTHVVMFGDKIEDVVEKYAKPILQANDWLFISEKVVAVTQGRAYKIVDIKVSFLANFLVKFVYKSPYGIGLGRPQTMQLAINEAGAWRILLGALVSAITKPFGVRGIFYKVVGKGINAIDGPCDYTLPPYNQYAVLGPKDPDKVAAMLAEKNNCEVVIVDANDLGVAILGASKNVDRKLAAEIFRDNPLGQTNEQTPLCVVRKI
ncbi:MAG: coenzyme F420-0:L-glutamate ligase [bacterium]